jgi:uncharacterized membrane protein
MTTVELHEEASAVPEIQTLTVSMLFEALRKGWKDFTDCPIHGLFFGGFYFLGGLMIYWVTRVTGETYWIFITGFGFPLLGPFAAVGLYEISRTRARGGRVSWGPLLSMAYRQKNRQLPSMIMVILLIFLFWAFVGHMIFTLFLGLSAMTNVMSSFEVFTTSNGMTMLAVGTVAGGILAGFLYSITVMGLPLLLDREIDFVTAMITSFQTVAQNAVVMGFWGLIIISMLVVGMLPYFLGLLVVFPVLGHASWHLYLMALKDGEAAE